MTSQNEPRRGTDLPQRVSTLELFFDLVFVFTITQLTSILARDMSFAAAGQVLLIFGVLWWMYGAYAWLTNTRTPVQAPERLLLLVGMAGFLIIGLAIPHAFGTSTTHGRDGVALGIGYLLVVLVHGGLFLRVNRNIQLVIPFNLASALLVIIAGLVPSGAAYALWAAALALQVLSPLVVPVRGRFTIAPAHFVERHGALIIVAFGESVADIGIGAEGQRGSRCRAEARDRESRCRAARRTGPRASRRRDAVPCRGCAVPPHASDRHAVVPGGGCRTGPGLLAGRGHAVRRGRDRAAHGSGRGHDRRRALGAAGYG